MSKKKASSDSKVVKRNESTNRDKDIVLATDKSGRRGDLTKQEIRRLLPKGTRTMVTDELIDKINRIDDDPTLVDSMKENFVTYIEVLKQGKYKLEDYISAVKFVSYKLLGASDIDAYDKTFPERYERLQAEGLGRPDMGPYVTAYKKNKLVIQIMEQTLVPSYVLNAPMFQQALNVQCELMMTARSEMVRMRAAESVMEYTKQPEQAKLDIRVGMDEESKDRQDKLDDQMAQVAVNQKLLLERGASLEEIQKLNIVSEDVLNVDIEEDDEEDEYIEE